MCTRYGGWVDIYLPYSLFWIIWSICPTTNCQHSPNKIPFNVLIIYLVSETEPDLPLNVWVSPVEVWVSSGLPQGQGLWVQETWVWHKPSWRRSPLTPPELTQDWRNRLLEGTNKTLLCAPGSRRKEQWPQKKMTQTFLWMSRSLQWRHGSIVACCGVRGTDYNSSGSHGMLA